MRIAQILRTMIAVATFGFAAAFAAENPGSELLVGDVRPGTKCYALTVFNGQAPEKFKLKVVGDAPAFNNGKRLILAEMEGGMPVVAGMSGSPVYCGDKLVGALSYRFGVFPLKKDLAGITPIRYMRDQKDALGKKTAARAEAGGGIRPIAVPLFANGVRPEEIYRFDREAPNENLVFVPAGWQGQGSARERIGTIAPGDSVTMFLSRGAFEIGGICTVTEATEKTFSACGHHLLGEGAVELPVYRSSVARTFMSSFDSFKIAGDAIEPVGTIVYDNAFAVEGVRELRPDIMIPVNLSFTVDGDRYDYRFEVLRHRFYTPLIIDMGIRSLLGNLWAEKRLGTARIEAEIFLRGVAEPVKIYGASLIKMEEMQIAFMQGYADPWKRVLGKFEGTLADIEESEWNFKVDRVELALDVKSGNRILMFDSLAVLDKDGKPTEEFRQGDKLTVVLGMRSEDSTQKLVRKFTVEAPRDLNLVKPENEADTFLDAELYIMSGTEYREMDPKKLPKAKPDSREEFLRVLRLNQRDPSEMFAVLVLPPEYQSANHGTAAPPELKDGAWNSVGSLEFLHERKKSSESRVIYLPLGAPEKDVVVSFSGMRRLKLMLK